MASRLLDAFFGLVVLLIGVLNLLLVHPVPGMVGVLLSLAYVPATNDILKTRFGCSIPLPVKILLGLLVTWFTLGVSDLGDMLD